MVWLDAQGRLVLLDRLRELALPRERITPGVVGVNIVRLEAQGRLVVLDRLRELALPREREAQAKLTDGGSGIDGNGMAPKFFRVVPDADLVPGERSQAEEENNSEPGDQERSPAPSGEQAGTGQDRPSEACQVGISISSDLRAALKDPEHRQEDHDVSHPRRRQARHTTAEGQDDRRDGGDQTVTQEERRRPWIYRGGQLGDRRGA